MGRRLNTDHDKPFRYTERYTLNARVPLPGDADSEIKPSWLIEPVPPGPPEERWMISNDSSDDRTTWVRVVRDYWGTTRLAAAGRVIARMLQIKAPDKPEG
jgi:hypothetical protein